MIVLIVVGGFTPAAGVSASVATQATPTLQVQAPSQVNSGELVHIELLLVNAASFGGFEAAILYDSTAAEFAGIVHAPNARVGERAHVPLVVVQTASGSALGYASCPVTDCLAERGSPVAPGQDTALATLDLLPLKDGNLEIELSALKFVDSAGNPMGVNVPTSTLMIQVGTSGDTHAAPSSLWTLSNSPVREISPDITRPHIVTYADAMEVALEWTRSRQAGAPCANLNNPRVDVNRDGCVDVADLQAVLANFSPASAPVPGANQESSNLTLTVTSTGDESDVSPGDGGCMTPVATCTLRAAIQEANAHVGADTITFGIPGGGVHAIQLTRALDSIHDATGGLTIDGYSQPGTSPNSDPGVSNAQLKIQVTGQGTDEFGGMTVTSANNVIRGLAFHNLWRSLWLYGNGASNNTIAGNFIGTNAEGTLGEPSNGVLEAGGIKLESGAHDNLIGGTPAGDRNVISGNAGTGVSLWHTGTTGNRILNNLVGLAPGGATRLANRAHGVDINFGAANNRVGGANAGERNVIAGNTHSGVEISHTAGTTQNQVVGNYIGTTASGTGGMGELGNSRAGIALQDRVTNNVITGNIVANNPSGGIRLESFGTCCVTGNQITENRIGVGADGSALPNESFGIWVIGPQNQIGPNNVIANNKGPGIQVEDNTSDGNRITRNIFRQNGGLAIDLAPLLEVNPNDAGDADTGPNEQLNFPVIATALPNMLTGTACANCTVEIYRTDNSTDAHGEAEEFLTATTAQADGSFSAPLSGISVGQFVTALAIDAQGSTSEFARNVEITSQPQPVPTTTPPPPAEVWQSADIGTTFAGTTTVEGDSVSVRGSGRDVWSKADSFRFVYQPTNGDVEFKAYLSEWDGPGFNTWAKAGLMIRSSTSPNAANMLIMVTGEDTVRMQWRAKDGRKTNLTSAFDVSRPVWLKLVKAGNQLSAYLSPDNSNWTQVGNTQSIELGANFLYGAAITPHVDGAFVSAAFHGIEIAPVQAVGLEQPPEENQDPEAITVKTLHIGGLETGSSSDGNSWVAVLDVMAHNANHSPRRYVTIVGRWGDGANGRAKCTTDATGRCALLVQDIPNSAAQVTFEFTALKRKNAQYRPAENHWGDRTGDTSVRVEQP